MRKKQRLLVCLDGTWNKRDDSTNVLHHFGLAFEGDLDSDGETVTQVKYYDEGVGTGVIDGITGGGFGFGLEENVREAYDWLVEVYHDGNEPVTPDKTWDPKLADEIYIFGFSRGAYTARSLVGFISTCGLIRRGAPISVNELWEAYCILGREREKRSGLWDKVFGETPAKIRKITDLVCDPWRIKKCEEQRGQTRDTNGPNDRRVPGQLVNELNKSESLLVQWSRRVRITYLGIYDTVGAVGIDALAIPGVKSKLAMHHNMRATTIVQNCRHALAIDEHRSSFSHTPLLSYAGHGLFEDDDRQNEAIQQIDIQDHAAAAQPAATASPSDEREAAKKYWARKEAMWRRKIEQRWFVGAHSNIGGGYPDNVLAQRPFSWLLEGAQQARLRSEDFAYVAPAKFPLPEDSYTEFAKPFWTQIIRGKRNYRPIGPEREIHASNKKAKKGGAIPAGYSTQTINETVDDTVFAAFQANPDYRPPNLFEYAARQNQTGTPGNGQPWNVIAKSPPKHLWMGPTIAAHLYLVLWATCASFGLRVLNDLFLFSANLTSHAKLLYLAGFIFALVDWFESRASFRIAITPQSPRKRAFLDSIYWLRTLGFVLFVFGAIGTIAYLWVAGWHAQNFADAWRRFVQLLVVWWPVPASAAAGVIVANLLDGAEKERQKAGVIGAIGGAVTTLIVGVGLVLMGWLFARIFAPIFGFPKPVVVSAPTNEAKFAGLLLQLQLAFVYFLNAFSWVGEPMLRANFGSIIYLQRCFTPNGVGRALEKWRRMLRCHWDVADDDQKAGPAAMAMRRIVRESLWRDIFGYIPLYSAVFVYALWFAHYKLGWACLAREYVPHIPLWLLIPLVAAVADYVEDLCHFRYLHLHKKGDVPSMPLTLFSFTVTVIKFIAWFLAEFLTLGALIAGSVKVARAGELVGWRGTVALLISTFAVLAVVALAIGVLLYRVKTKRDKKALRIAR